jgi:hypothetical protein
MSVPVSENQIVRYLLDELAEEERGQLEERLSREPLFFEQVASIEDNLIMQYVRGDLEGKLLPRFTEVYLSSPAKRARIESARVWQSAVRDAAVTRSSAGSRVWRLRLSLAAAAVVMILVASWLLLRFTAPTDGLRVAPQVSFSLDPGLVRSGGGVKIRIPPGTQVRLRLALANPPGQAVYRVVVGTPERPNIWSGAAVLRDTSLTTVVPADVLSAGDYTLQLQTASNNNWENVATYYFRVEQ